jgi:K+-sensing histidine kinase KdpD
VALVAAVTGVIAIFDGWVPVLSLGVLYVFAVLPVAVVWGLRYALPVSVACMLAFNWFFLPPQHTFTLADGENWFALAVYLATAVVVSDLAARTRRRAATAEQRERESALLATVASDLLAGRDLTTGRERAQVFAAGRRRARPRHGDEKRGDRPRRRPGPGASGLRAGAGLRALLRSTAPSSMPR